MSEHTYHPTDSMEAPCLCPCGHWFDLDHSYQSQRRPGEVICKSCHTLEIEEIELEEDIAEAKLQVADAEYNLKYWKEHLDTLEYKQTAIIKVTNKK